MSAVFAPRFATNARNLLEARQNGFAPAETVHVTLVGGQFDGTALYVREEMAPASLDWRMLVNLDVQLWAGLAIPLDRVVDCSIALAQAKPKTLFLRFLDSQARIHDLDLGSGHHHGGAPEVGINPEHSFLWFPINTGGTALGYRLLKALKASTRNLSTTTWN